MEIEDWISEIEERLIAIEKWKEDSIPKCRGCNKAISGDPNMSFHERWCVDCMIKLMEWDRESA